MKVKKMGVILPAVFICMGIFMGCSGGSSETDDKIAEMTMKLERLQKQVNDVQAVEAIEKLQTQYLNFVSDNKLDDVWTLFSEDGVMDVFQEKPPAKGADEITAIFQERKAMIEKNLEEGSRAIMFESSPIITVEGDTATSSFLLFNMMEADEQRLGVQQGAYHLDFIKENGQWKISYLKYTREFSIGASPAMGRGPGELPPPGREASGGTKVE